MCEWVSFKDSLPDVQKSVDLYCEISGRHTDYSFIKNYKKQKGNNFFMPNKQGKSIIRYDEYEVDRAVYWCYIDLP